MNTSSISTRSPSFGVFPSTAERLEQLGIGDDRRATVDAERVADAGNEEQQPDVRVREDVAQRVREPVAGALRDEQRALVEDADEAGRVATRAHVAGAVGRRCREAA